MTRGIPCNSSGRRYMWERVLAVRRVTFDNALTCCLYRNAKGNGIKVTIGIPFSQLTWLTVALCWVVASFSCCCSTNRRDYYQLEITITYFDLPKLIVSLRSLTYFPLLFSCLSASYILLALLFSYHALFASFSPLYFPFSAGFFLPQTAYTLLNSLPWHCRV